MPTREREAGSPEDGEIDLLYRLPPERFTAARDLRFVRQLNPELQSFGDWLAVHKSEITLG